MAANGDGPRNHPLVKDLKLPPLGIPGPRRAAAHQDAALHRRGQRRDPGTNRDWLHGRMFRAYDKATGAVVWETELPAGTTGAPITYMHQGKQYIVVADRRARAAAGVRRLRAAVRQRPRLALSG